MSIEAGESHPRKILPLLMSMIGTRLELAAIDTEAHVAETMAAIMAAFIAVVLALIAFTFVGVAVIVLFWDTHRVEAAMAVVAAYVGIATVVGLLARSTWRSRPAAFSATLRELELDRAAFRSRP